MVHMNEKNREKIQLNKYIVIWLIIVTIIVIAFFVDWYMDRLMNAIELSNYMVKCSNNVSPITNSTIPKLTDFIEDDVFNS